MVSAISVCLLALGLSAASSQLLSSDADYPESDTPISERRTFKHGKPVKFLPLIKKHKKFGGFVPHAFGKTQYTEIPVAPKPFYKVHRYQGIEVKPVSDVTYSTPEPIIESHSVEAPSDFPSDHSYSSSPVFSSPPATFYAPPKPVFSFVPAPQPVFSSVPITIPSSQAFSFSVARPAVIPQPVFAPIPANLPPPPQPIFSAVPIKIQTPVLPAPSPAPVFPAPSPAPVFSAPSPAPVFSAPSPAPVFSAPSPAPVFPAPSPAPVFQAVPIKIQPPVLPALPAPSPAPVVVKIPAPVPVIPAPSPAPVFHSVSPTPGPTFSSFPTALPPTFSFPSPAPSAQSFPAFQSISAAPEPEYPYPPSGTPIPSYIKDISLGDIEIKGSPAPTIETPEVSPIVEDTTKTIEHNPGGNGFFQKIKGWKADKAQAALSHLTQFKQKPFIHSSIPLPTVHKLPEIPPSQLPIHPTLQFSPPAHPLPLAPAQVFFPPAQFNPSIKYENFPPNNLETPPLLNSYGVPIPHDSYSPPHDRLSSAASEEEPAVVPPPSEKKEQTIETKPQPPQQEYQPHNYQFQPQAIPHEHPIYVPEDLKTIKEDNKTIENQQPEIDQNPQDSAYPNHKE